MTQTTDPPDQAESQRRKPIPARRLVWAVFLTCCVLFGWLKAVQNRKAREDYEAATQKHEQVAATAKRLDQETSQRIRDLWDRKRKLGWQRRAELSRQVLEEELNQGKPFSLRPDEGSADGRQVATWVDPAGGQEFNLRFRGDEWVGFSSGQSGRSKLRPQHRPRAVYGDTREQIRKLATGYGPLFWLLSLVLLGGLQLLRTLLRGTGLPRYGQSLDPHCRVLAECLLAFAVFSTVGWLVNPYYSITYRGVTSNDNLALGAILLAISIPVLARMTSARIPEPGEARRPLQFSLKSLLLVTAACALVFASAPFGYVVALYAVGGIALYVVVRWLT